MNYERITNSEFMRKKINTCQCFHSCALCPYYKNNKFPEEDFIGGCDGYGFEYRNHYSRMERNEYFNRLKVLEDRIVSGEIDTTKNVAEKILKRLMEWKGPVIFDGTNYSIEAEKRFEEAIKALAKEDYGIDI